MSPTPLAQPLEGISVRNLSEEAVILPNMVRFHKGLT